MNMQSKVITLYDYRSDQVPEELTCWRVMDQEIEEQLASLAQAHAKIISVENVEIGDAVKCICMGADLQGRATILLYPGRSLPGAKEAEISVIGKKKNDVFATTINGTALTLQVQEILRRGGPLTIDDALVKLEQIEGVNTVMDYARWYRDQKEPDRRKEAAFQIGQFWFRRISRLSEFAIDQEEQKKWAKDNARLSFHSMVAAGENPCIPEEGFTLLTEEEAMEKMAERILPQFSTMVAARALAGERGIVFDKDGLEPKYQQIAAFLHCTLEEAKKEVSSELVSDGFYVDQAVKILCEEAETFLEV